MDSFQSCGMGQDGRGSGSNFRPGYADNSGTNPGTYPQYWGGGAGPSETHQWGGEAGPSETMPFEQDASAVQRSCPCRFCGHNPDLDENIRKVIMVTCAVCVASRRRRRRNQRLPMFPVGLPGADYVEGVLNHPSTTNFQNNYRMVPRVFRLLADILVAEGGYKPTERVGVQEALCMFMKIVGHGETHRQVMDRFQHSGETVNSCFHGILDALCRLAPRIICPRHIEGIHPHIEGNPKYDPWFKVRVLLAPINHISLFWAKYIIQCMNICFGPLFVGIGLYRCDGRDTHRYCWGLS